MPTCQRLNGPENHGPFNEVINLNGTHVNEPTVIMLAINTDMEA
jgi:hypothetical protein